MSKRILITAGGTGGHIYPAQGLAQQLTPEHEILFVAGGLQKNRYFDRNFPYQEVACAPVLSKNPLKLTKGALQMIKGFNQSIKILREFRPDMVVGFGSFYTVPILLAAKWLSIPIILHEANSIPGKVNKWFAPFVDHVGVHFPHTLSLLKGRPIEVGMPLRAGFKQSFITKEEALTYFQLDHDKPTLLIFGGSQGARAINQLLMRQTSYQIIHVTGDEKNVKDIADHYTRHGIKACVKPFETQMNLAWTCADLFIARSGASTIAEAMEFEVPGILIPYPHATDNHQEKNADFLVDTAGGGIKLLEKNLTVEKLENVLKDSQILPMKKAIQAYKQRENRQDLYQLILKRIK